MNNSPTQSVLMVDDEEPVRLLVQQTLRRHGYVCTTAANCAEARKILDDRNFELMLCDIRMPGESGLDLVEEVRTANSDMAVVMFTGVDDMAVARRAIELDVYGYLVKPVARSQILIVVANALRRRELELREKAYQQGLEQMVCDRTAELEAANAALRQREAELQDRTRQLEDLNAALRVLLKKREEDQRMIEENVLANIQKTVKPRLQRFNSGGGLNKSQKAEIDSIEAELDDLASPFAKRLSSEWFGLSPAEIQVADLVQQGKTTKEIANTLNLSVNTIMTHRYKVRTKLGIRNSRQNLRSYLNTLREI